MDKNDEPRASAALWALVVLLFAVIVLAYFLGRSNGQQEGVEKGQRDSQIQRITDDLQQLKQSKAADERVERNLRLAEELTNSNNNGAKK